MIRSYEIKEKLKAIKNYDIENSNGCYNCPLAVSGSNTGGGYVSCLHYGEIASWCDRGGGIDYDIDRGDGTRRLPQCEIKLGQMKAIYVKHALNSINIAVVNKQKEVKELQSLRELLY